MHEALAAKRGCRSTRALLREAKELGFSDRADRRADRRRRAEPCARCAQAHGIVPHLAQIDTLAAEFPAETNYLYSSYHATHDDVAPSAAQEDPGARLGRLPHRLERRVRLVLRQRGPGRARSSATRPSCSTTTRRRSAPTTTCATG